VLAARRKLRRPRAGGCTGPVLAGGRMAGRRSMGTRVSTRRTAMLDSFVPVRHGKVGGATLTARGRRGAATGVAF
jgi:hypothetical protein